MSRGKGGGKRSRGGTDLCFHGPDLHGLHIAVVRWKLSKVVRIIKHVVAEIQRVYEPGRLEE